MIEKSPQPITVRLWYRHVNQAERYQVTEIKPQDREYRVAIPGSYTASNYPLQYYFELKQGLEKAWLYPGFAPELAHQPDFVVHPVAPDVATAGEGE